MSREAGKGDDPCVTNFYRRIAYQNKTDVYMLGSKKCPILVIHLKMMIWTCWGMTWRDFLDHKQTLRVLQKIYFHLLHAQPLRFESLSLRTPQTVPPTPAQLYKIR